MQIYLSDEGVKAPSQTTDNINKLNTQQSNGALLYDTNTKQLKVCIDGVFKVVQTT
jgi:hypothetical protein